MKRLSHWLFLITLLFLPSQLEKHFWPSFALVLGRRIDYLSPTIGVTDILLLSTVFFTLLISRPTRQQLRFFLVLLLVIGLFLLINPQLLSFYGYVKVIGLFLFAWVVIAQSPSYIEVLLPLSIGITLSTLLTLLQFFAQKSIGGIWSLFGERSFSAQSTGIAQLVVSGRLLLRPYATFPHPNVLGGYFAALLPLFLFWQPPRQHYWWRQLTCACLALGIFLSFSRAAWVVSVGMVLFYYSRSKIKRRRFITVGLVLFFLSLEELLLSRFNSLWLDWESFEQRQQLTRIALAIFKHSPLFGVGLLQFIPTTTLFSRPPFLLQPAHSIYLLVLAETGIVGFVGSIMLLVVVGKRLWQQKKIAWFCSLLCLLLLGSVDHYPITLPQTQLLFSLILASAFV